MIRRTLAALVMTALAVGVPAVLVLGTSAPAQACFFTPTAAERPLCGGGSVLRLLATPTTVTVGEPITLKLLQVGATSTDVTASGTFSISSGSCTANVCTPDTAGTATLTGVVVGNGDGPASTTVPVLPRPDHLALSPQAATVAVGQGFAYTVQRAAADGTVIDDVTASASLTLDGVPCTGATCRPTTPGAHVVIATYGALGGSTSLYAEEVTRLVVTPSEHQQWNNVTGVIFTVEAYDIHSVDLGDLTSAASFAVAPDGSCAGNVCTATTAGPHTVTVTVGAATATVTLDATAPVPTVAPVLRSATVGEWYAACVLSFCDETTTAQVDDASTLPPGLFLSINGALSGTPTTAGTYTFDVTASSGNYAQNQPTTITIAPAAVPPPLPKVSTGPTSVREGSSGRKVVQVLVRLSTPSSSPVTVAWHTVNGTAVAGKDYVAAHGTVTIPAGQLSATVPVSIIGDRLKEANEKFAVVLTAPQGATLGTARGPVTVVDDD